MEDDKELEKLKDEMKKNNLIIQEAKRFLTKEQIEFLNSELEDIEVPSNCEIVDFHKGDKQRDNIMDHWVDQRSVGMSGDDFEGEDYFKLSNGKYLKWSYRI